MDVLESLVLRPFHCVFTLFKEISYLIFDLSAQAASIVIKTASCNHTENLKDAHMMIMRLEQCDA